MQPTTTPPAVFETAPPAYLFLGVRMRVLLSARQTGGQFSMIEGVVPPGGDGGLHLHLREDESMHLLEGELEVTIGEERLMLKAGSSYFAPRAVPHRLRNRSAAPARTIAVMTPGGFDELIAQAGTPLSDQPPAAGPPSPEQIAQLLQLAEAFGIRVIEPPAAVPATAC